MVRSSADVVVIGAGPSGSHVARGLAGLGYEVMILEEHRSIGAPVHCTGIISAEACRQLGLVPDLIAARLSGARFVSPGGQSLHVSAPEPRAVVVDRRRLDQWLCDQAAADGAQLLLGARAGMLSVENGGVTIVAEIGGQPVTFRCSLAVVATGAKPSPLAAIGSVRSRGSLLHAAQVEARRVALTDVEVFMGSAVAPGGFAWAVPVNGKCRLGLISRRPAGAFLDRFVSGLEERGAVARNGARAAYHRVPMGSLTPSFSDRVLVVGDAAGQVKTTTGGGLYFGLIGAQAAVETAHTALRSGDLSAAGLSRYEESWRSRLGPEQRLGRILRKIQAALSDDDLELLFSIARRMRMSDVLSQLHFDWHSCGVLSVLRHLASGPQS